MDFYAHRVYLSRLRDRSYGWVGGGDLREDHLIFRRTKGGISRNLEPKREDHSNLLGKWRHRGGIVKVIKSYWGDHFSEVTFKGGIG